MEYTGAKLTEDFEGLRLTAYQDVRGIWTIGYGHTSGVYEGMTCTPAQADAWLMQDIDWAVQVVNEHVTGVNQLIFNSLVDFVYNVGSGNFEHSTLLKLITQGRWDEAADEFDKWDVAGGKVVAGLLRRREAEKAEFEAGVLSSDKGIN